MKKFGLPALLILLLLSPSAFGHPLDMGLLEIKRTNSGFTSKLELNQQAAAALLDKKNQKLTILEAQGAAAKLFAATWGKSPTPAGCQWAEKSSDLTGENIILMAAASCPEELAPTHWNFAWIASPALLPTFQLVVHFRDGAQEGLRTLSRATPSTEWTVSSSEGFGDFVLAGMQHIGATPSAWYSDGEFHLAEGIDHVLFVVALLLAAPMGWPLIKALTGFTLGHSITLALVSLGHISVSGAIVEPVIALSIALISLLTLLGKKVGHWWPLTAFFGLVHGMGFGSALLEKHLQGQAMITALIGFNVGVELGQLTVVLFCLPFYVLCARTLAAKALTVNVGSAGITAAGFYWFVVRLLAIVR